MEDTSEQSEYVPTFVVATKVLHADGPPTLFRSYQCTGRNADPCTIWEAARATSAAPLFFKPITIKTPAPGGTYTDGGLGHNNPAEVALLEARRLWSSVKKFALVSVGTGRSKSIRIAENTVQSFDTDTSRTAKRRRGITRRAAVGEIALTRIQEACVELAFNSEQVHQRLYNLSVDPENRFPYHRFNVERDMHEIDLHEWDAMEALGSHTTSYMEEVEQELKQNKCVEDLISPPAIQCKTKLVKFGLRMTVIRSMSPRHFLMPYQRNPHFTGRDDLLVQLSQKLRDIAAKRYNHRVAIHGMGGVGKTQLAIEYVYQNEDKYHSIFWISAADQAALFSGFREIARMTGCVSDSGLDTMPPDRLAKVVLMWLRKQSRWLLVMDNMDEISVAVDFLPYMSPSGHILITTRNPDHLTIPAEGLEIPVLGEDAAIELLLLRGQVNSAGESPDRVHAAQIVRELGYLALAIEQVAAFIRLSVHGVAEFLAIYRKSRLQFLERGLSENQSSVAATFLLSIDKVSKARKGPQAVALLRLLAFLNPDGVLIDFLRSGRSGLDDSLREIIDDELVFQSSLELLHRYAVIGLWRKKGHIIIHRLVQAVIKDTSSELELRALRNNVIRLCDSAFPNINPEKELTVAERVECRRIQNQCLEPVIEAVEASSDAVPYLMYKIGKFLMDDGKFLDGERYYRLCVAINTSLVGDDGKDTLTSMRWLQQTLWFRGKLDEAALLQQKVWHGSIRIYGVEHPKTLLAICDFATTMRVQGHLDTAAALQETVLKISVKVMGQEHPYVLTNMSNFALILYDQGQLEKACTLQEKVWKTRTRVQGEEHCDTLRSMASLAVTLDRQGKHEQAETMHEKVLKAKIKILGEEHLETFWSMYHLAVTYINVGRSLEAKDLLKKAVEGHRKVLGEDHPNSISMANNYNRWFAEVI